MRKKVILSTDAAENERMKFLQAQNRVFRLYNGEKAVKNILQKQGPLIPKINTLFYYIEKYDMTMSRRILWFEVNKFYLYRLLYISLPIPRDWLDFNKTVEQLIQFNTSQ